MFLSKIAGQVVLQSFFLSAYFQLFHVVFLWLCCRISTWSVPMAFALVLPKLIAYLSNYLCGCCGGGGVDSFSSWGVDVVGGCGWWSWCSSWNYFVRMLSNCSKKKNRECSISDLKMLFFRHTDVPNRMFQFEGSTN